MPILQFPSSRAVAAVRVETARDGDGWYIVLRSYGELYGDFDSAFRAAHEIAAGTVVLSSRGVSC